MGNLIMAILLVKHFFADGPLQNLYMLIGKSKKGTAWILPLGTHAGVHAAFTALIFGLYDLNLAYLGLIDFAFHFAIDKLKVSFPVPAGVWAPEERGKNLALYYRNFLLDQLAHGLTYCLLVHLAGL